MFIRNLGYAFVACLALSAQSSEAQERLSALPNGARSLTEEYGNWTVQCGIVTRDEVEQRDCVMGQRQNNDQGQQILSIELRPEENGVAGFMVMPFGVAVREPISLIVDGGTDPLSAEFSTCMPAGCIVPIRSGSEMLTAMRDGNQLVVSTRSSDGENYSFPISLNGFTAAINRIGDLAD